MPYFTIKQQKTIRPMHRTGRFLQRLAELGTDAFSQNARVNECQGGLARFVKDSDWKV